MTIDAWVKIYVALIKADRKTLKDVPKEFYEKVKYEIEKGE